MNKCQNFSFWVYGPFKILAREKNDSILHKDILISFQQINDVSNCDVIKMAIKQKY